MPDLVSTQSHQEHPRPPWIVWLGLAVVLGAAAVLSFDALRALGIAVGIPEELAWLLPVAVDAGAAVSCATWLGGRTHADAARFAGRMTWGLLATTVLGNAGQLGMHAYGIVPPWWVAVLVGSIPPAVVGSTVHLIVLLVRRPTNARPVGDQRSEPVDVVVAGALGDASWRQEASSPTALPTGAPAAPAPQPTGRTTEPTAPADEFDRGLDSTARNEDLIADMRHWAADRGRPVSRDDAMNAYGIGAGRARTLRLACGWPKSADEEADRSDAEPTAVGVGVR